ncbi:MAG: PEP-CTERM sorting domain-containing protein [Pirellulaceae bacterium]
MIRRIILACILSSVATSQVNADLIIDVQNASLNAQGIGFVDVYLTGEVGDTLGAFGYEFNIAGATAQSGDLQFRVVQLDSEQNESGPPPYVFLGDTDPGSFNSVQGGNAVTLVGGDALASLDSVPVNGEFLLARLELQHVGPLVGTSHDFTVSLNAASPFTFFDRDFDPGTNDPGVTDDYGSFTALSGTVTVSSAAVPEPSSLAMLSLIAIGGSLARKMRQKCSRKIAPDI